MKDQLFAIGKEISGELREISDFMYYNPEIGNKEYKAAEKLTTFLSKYGFAVKYPVLGIATAFEAVYDSKKPGPHVAFLCE